MELPWILDVLWLLSVPPLTLCIAPLPAADPSVCAFSPAPAGLVKLATLHKTQASEVAGGRKQKPEDVPCSRT